MKKAKKAQKKRLTSKARDPKTRPKKRGTRPIKRAPKKAGNKEIKVTAVRPPKKAIGQPVTTYAMYEEVETRVVREPNLEVVDQEEEGFET